MTRTNILLVATVSSIAVFFGGCATVRGTAPVNIDQSSLQALAASVQEAFESKNFAAMLECLEPGRQAQYDRLFVDAQLFWEKIPPLAKLIEEKIGRKQAETFLQRAKENVMPSPFAEAVVDGKVDWSRVQFKVEGLTASARIGSATCFKARRIDTKWYMTPEIDDDSFDASVRMGRALYQGAAAAASHYERQIRNGTINKSNVDEKLFGMDKSELERRARWAATSYGPIVDGVRIRITTVPKAFRKDERIWFHIDIKYETDDRICWRIPGIGPDDSFGVGENILLEIDGKAVEQPHIKAKEICGSVYTTEAWSVYLPSGFRLGPGQHSVRYTIISGGGMYRHIGGQRYRILNGRLVSNTLKFTIRD